MIRPRSPLSSAGATRATVASAPRAAGRLARQHRMPPMTKRHAKMTEELRQYAARECGGSQAALARAAEIDPAALGKFLSGESGLARSDIESLGDVLSLHVLTGRIMRPRSPRPDRPRRRGLVHA
jgi:hypothetical protein